MRNLPPGPRPARPVEDVFERIGRYESALAQRGLRDIPLHMNPLMRANDAAFVAQVDKSHAIARQ